MRNLKTVRECAEETGINPYTIRAAVRLKKVYTEKFYNRRLIDIDELRELYPEPKMTRGVKSSTGIKGVSFYAERGTYRAAVNFYGKSIFLGEFKTKDAAAAKIKEWEESVGKC